MGKKKFDLDTVVQPILKAIDDAVRPLTPEQYDEVIDWLQSEGQMRAEALAEEADE